ncbi:MAG: MBL fold metallo-hydrolase [Spirochaetales bacterium]|nr:MBL fold metallo-hydrolase [Spirochaetales bacterium]
MNIRKLDGELKLQNEGKLSLFFLGVGNAFSKRHYQNNLLVIKGSDSLLIDCGTICSTAFCHYKSSISHVHNFMITHSHADHIGGLEEAMLTGRYVTKIKPNIIITDEYKTRLWENSLKGGNAWGECNDGRSLNFEDYFEQIRPQLISETPRPLYQAKIGNIDIKIFRTKHMPDNALSWKDSFFSYGVVIDERILFPSDTRFDLDMITWLYNKYPIEIIFHDCQFYSGGVHASYDELKQLPAEIKSKMYLCHYGDNYEKFTPKNDGFIDFAQQGCYYDFD